MATTQGGFDAVFVAELSERLTCPICRLALKEPQLTKCGHNFCKSCLFESVRQASSCPVCRTQLEASKIFPNNAVKREILDMNIKCNELKKGCEWVGELRERDGHNKQCDYVDEKCANNCGELVIRKDMMNHKEKLCPRRKTSCEHCFSRIEWNVLQDHHEKCPNFPVMCTYNCGEVVARYKMTEHVGHHGTCPSSLLDCKFKNMGCLFRGNRSDLMEHGKDDADHHCSLLANKLVATEQELEETKSKLAIVFDRGFSTGNSVLGRSRESLKGYFLPVNPPDSFVHRWRIENWSQKILEAKAGVATYIDSNPFYISPGYHLYLKASINQSDDDSHLGIYLFAREGDFDGSIKWPFPFSFTLEVVNQQPYGKSISHRCSPPYPKRALQYPATCHFQKGCGEPKMGSLETLETRCYIKDDAIIIKLTVHMKDDYGFSLGLVVADQERV